MSRRVGAPRPKVDKRWLAALAGVAVAGCGGLPLTGARPPLGASSVGVTMPWFSTSPAPSAAPAPAAAAPGVSGRGDADGAAAAPPTGAAASGAAAGRSPAAGAACAAGAAATTGAKAESAEERAMRDYERRKQLEADPKARAEAAKREAQAAKARAEAAKREAAETRAAAKRAQREAAAEAKRQAAAEREAAAAARREAAEAAKREREAAAAAAKEAEAQRRAAAAAQAQAAAEARAAAKAKADAEAAERARARAEAERAAAAERERVAAEQRAAVAAAKAEAERAAEARRQQAAAEAAAAAAAKEAAARKAAADAAAAREAAVQADLAAARKAGTSGALAAFVVRHAERGEAAAAYAELQRAVVREASTWLSAPAASVAPELEEVALARAPATLRDDLARMRPRAWRVLAPRAVQVDYSLRNPTGRPMLVSLSLAGQRVHVLVESSGPVTGTAVAACVPAGTPSRELKDGILEYKLGCEKVGALELLGATPVEAALARDRHAADSGLSLGAIATLWQKLPNTWLAPVLADRVDDAMAAFARDTGAIRGSAKASRADADGSAPVAVGLKSRAALDATVFYTVGTGRVERLLVERGKTASIKLSTLPGLPATLSILRLMPRLRATDWLFGAWRTAYATLAILPGSNGRPTAFMVGHDASGLPTTTIAELDIKGDDFAFRGPAGVAFAKRLLGDTDTVPLKCDEPCEVRVRGSLIKQEGFERDGERQLFLMVEVGNRSKPVRMVARF